MTYTNENVNANGTSLKGYVYCLYSDLLECFGEPTYRNEDYKTKAEWVLQSDNGTVFTIYDWKTVVEPEDNAEWHIGGNSLEAVNCVKQIMQQKMQVSHNMVTIA